MDGRRSLRPRDVAMRRSLHRLFGCLAAIVLASRALSAQDSLRVSQAFVELPRITVYADILDAKANPAIARPGALKARIDRASRDHRNYSALPLDMHSAVTVS